MTAVFDYALWAQQFPALANVADETVATIYFNTAQTLIDNSGCSLIPNVAPSLSLQNVLYFATAHLITMFLGDGSNKPTGLVGRIESATEGSVSVSVGKYGTMTSDNAAWWAQTPAGAMVWFLLSPYRMGPIYTPAPCRRSGPIGQPYYSGYGVPWRR